MKFGKIICGWYKKNKRDLPWRLTSDPYLVWISEVILQQTRVIQGLEYYLKFAEAFPDIESLASASEDRVLKLWQGLGYYSRARNMHQAAKDLMEKNEGKMPETYKELLEMKGVGTYTASAIASICFGEEKAVVDGNVSRVIARLYGVEEAVNGAAGKKIIDSLAAQLLAESMGPGNGSEGDIASGIETRAGFDPGTHNQAMMEFGALQCVPSSPDCGACPLSAGCNATLMGRVNKLPLKTPKRKPLDRWMYFYVLKCGDETILTRRNEQGIWRSLYHFPVVEGSEEHTEQEICGELFAQVMAQLSLGVNENQPGRTVISGISEPLRHQLTHLTIHARFIHVSLASLPFPLLENFIRIHLGELDHYPVPRLMERYMESAKI